jgi:hypothetical protein
MARRIPGQIVDQPLPDGTILRAPVYNEHEVRTAAGITMMAGIVAFAYAYFEHRFIPIKVVSTFFFVEFVIRVFVGFQYTPTGLVSRALMYRREPQWVSAKPKRFAWTLGMLMAGSMTVITNVNIHGWWPRSICLICIVLMWCEAVLGLCIGCEMYAFLRRRGWVSKDDGIEICAGGVCAAPVPDAVTGAVPTFDLPVASKSDNVIVG